MGEPAAPPAEAPRGRRPSLPDQRTLLTWLFLARLGMSMVAHLRGGSVPALRARVAHAPSAVVRQKGRGGRSVGQVVAARRSQRRARIRQIAP